MGSGIGKQMSADFDSMKDLFGKGKKKKSFKQQYEERLKEKKLEVTEAEYKKKLEELDANEPKSDKVVRKLKKLLE